MAKRVNTRQKTERRPKRTPPSIESLRNAELLTVQQLPLVEPAFSEATLRWHLFRRDTNGLAASGAVVQVGRRVLIRPRLFVAWAAGQGPTPQ